MSDAVEPTDPRTLRPKPGLWVTWPGGDCPVPHGVPFQSLCRAGFCGEPLTTGPCWRWTHTADPADREYRYDIIAYRICPKAAR